MSEAEGIASVSASNAFAFHANRGFIRIVVTSEDDDDIFAERSGEPLPGPLERVHVVAVHREHLVPRLDAGCLGLASRRHHHHDHSLRAPAAPLPERHGKASAAVGLAGRRWATSKYDFHAFGRSTCSNLDIIGLRPTRIGRVRFERDSPLGEPTQLEVPAAVGHNGP